MYTQLETFHSIHGHCLVPFEFELNVALGHWVSQQRSDYKKGTIDHYRIEQLEKLGFIWSAK